MIQDVRCIALASALALAACSPPTATDSTSAGDARGAETAAAPSGGERIGVETVRVSFRQDGPRAMGVAIQGTRLVWYEAYGARVGVLEQVGPGGQNLSNVRQFWDGATKTSYLQNGDQPVSRQSNWPGVNSIEISAMVRSGEAERAAIGWTRQGERQIAGQTCEEWVTDRPAHAELCVWRGIDLYSSALGVTREAIEIVEGERIPAEIGALAARSPERR
jgi:hypothetical protein